MLSVSFMTASAVSAEENPCQLQAIRLKVGTLAPKGSFATMAVDFLDKYLRYARRMGAATKVDVYYGGVMGNDPQMIQKALLGQLDVLTPTINGLSLIAEELLTFSMAFLIENYGQYDYIMKKNSVYINNLLYRNGWLSLNLVATEGPHQLYLNKPYRAPKELRENLSAVNYTGGPDETFYTALNIPQVPVQPTEMYTAFRTKASNAVILPSAFVIGMQIYTTLSYVIDPPVRLAVTLTVVTKKKWETMPWNLRIYIASLQPAMYYFAYLVRDADAAYSQAMYSYGTKKVALKPEEFNEWRKAVNEYRKVYLGNDKKKLDIYNKIVKGIEEYKSGYPVERAIYERDKTFRECPDNFIKLSKALKEYCRTGSKNALAELEKGKVVEKWRFYDYIDACEKYINSGRPDELKKWMGSYYAEEVVEEIFSKHLDSIKTIFGTKEALRTRVEEISDLFDTGTSYKGFQKTMQLK